jgi:pyruvate formate lyase activating enzyme
MKLGGIIDISTKDIPGKSSMVLFTVGCNFNCEFCHNKYLLNPNVGREYIIEDLIDNINTNSLVSGVSITGGEPTLQDDLLELCKEIKTRTDKYLSIDTNGSVPKAIEELLPYIDRLALDIKGPLSQEKYNEIVKTYVDIKKIVQTIKIINLTNIDFEVRTTYVENLLNSNDINEIIQFLKKSGFEGNFVLQQYQYREGVGEEFKHIFSKPLHNALVEIMKPYKYLDLKFNLFVRDEIVGFSSINEL